jgi:hypothetical protein
VICKVAYLAVEAKEGHVFGMVCLLDYKPKHHFNFGYKDMDETMKPYYYNAPKSVLDKLTPLTSEDNQMAKEWRSACYATIQQKEYIKTLKKGDKIGFDKEFFFGKKGSATDFIVVDPAKGHFYAPSIGLTVRLTKTNLTSNSWVKL